MNMQLSMLWQAINEFSLSLVWQAIRTIYLSNLWFDWVVLLLVMIHILYLTKIVLFSLMSKKWKILFLFLNLPVAILLFYVPTFYKTVNVGLPDTDCPRLLVNTLTGEIETVKYEYVGHHEISGPSGVGFVDILALNSNLFGRDKYVKNAHLCRVSNDEGGKKLKKNLAKAKKERSDAAKAAGLDNGDKFGKIMITLPGNVLQKAKLKSQKRRSSNGKKKEKALSDETEESFSSTEFEAPKKKDVIKEDGYISDDPDE
jgi:hypothetical protein